MVRAAYTRTARTGTIAAKATRARFVPTARTTTTGQLESARNVMSSEVRCALRSPVCSTGSSSSRVRGARIRAKRRLKLCVKDFG